MLVTFLVDLKSTLRGEQGDRDDITCFGEAAIR